MIREATLEDIPRILDIGRRFCSLAGQQFNEPVLAQSLAEMITADSSVILVSDGGVIAGIAYPYYFSGELVAQELFWWADSGGLKLLQAFEEWARNAGAKRVLMICLESVEPDRVARIYTRRGYIPIERTFMRTI